MNSERIGYIELVMFSLLAGVVGIFVKLVQNMDIYSIIFFRALIGSVFILLLILFRKRLKDLAIIYPFKTLLVGIFQGLSIFLYFSAILTTSVSNAVFLLYTAPIFSVLFAKFFLKENIEKETIIGIAITLAGIIFILDPRTFSFNSSETMDDIMGLASGFFYAAMALTAKPIMEKKPGHYTAFWQYVIITAMFAFFLKVGSPSIVIANWWKLLTIGVFCTGIAFILFMEGVRRVKAQEIFIITSIEPLVGTIFALIILKEVPSFMAFIGAMLILYGVFRVTNRKEI